MFREYAARITGLPNPAVVPELVAALQDCAESLARLSDGPDAYRVTCLQQARALLTRCEGKALK